MIAALSMAWGFLKGVPPWFYLVIALAAGVYLYGEHCTDAGRSEVQVKWDKDKLAKSEANRKAILDAVAKNEVAHRLDVEQSNKVIANYETTIDNKNALVTAARADADTQRMRIKRSTICGATTTTGQTAGSVKPDGEGAGETVDLPSAIASGLRDIAEDDDRQIVRKDAKIAALQQWAIDHGFYWPTDREK